MKIFTQRLVLRNFEESDIDAYLSMTAGEQYQTFYPDEQCSEQFGTQLVQSFVQEAQQWPRKRFHMAIWHSQQEIWLGVASARIESDGRVSIGFGLHPKGWGNGYTVEAMKALIEFMQREFQMSAFYAETLRDNGAAISVLEQLGFKLASVYPQQFYFKERSWDGAVYQYQSPQKTSALRGD
jgi:RimJ/RimL family protein N-acetyltransferase